MTLVVDIIFLSIKNSAYYQTVIYSVKPGPSVRPEFMDIVIQPREKNRILIVEDESAIRNSMGEYMEAVEALNLLRKTPVDVVITDIVLSGKDGLELTDIIKTEFDIDIIVMTGYIADFSYEDAINRGASDFVFKPVRFEELHLRLKRVLRERQLSRERALMLDELHNLAITDGLTQLYNSRYFYKQLDQEISRVFRYDRPLSILLLDIDHFKNFNDTYGHMEGDKVLVMISRKILSCLRKNDSAYRYGGEEFTVLLPETDSGDALLVAERIRETIEKQKLCPAPDTETNRTISIGVTQYTKGERVSAFVERADRAMYQSKQKGRNRVSLLLSDRIAPSN
jgi:two-component system cell cycle response regulator